MTTNGSGCKCSWHRVAFNIQKYLCVDYTILAMIESIEKLYWGSGLNIQNAIGTSQVESSEAQAVFNIPEMTNATAKDTLIISQRI